MSTETIDLSNLFTRDMYSSGTFDLSSVGSTALGYLLEALPMPAILIDQRNCVEFANQSFEKMMPDYKEIRGIPFLDLLPQPSDTNRARALADKTIALLNRVFATRKPRVAEAILELNKNRIWGRLHLRAVRIGSERYVLMLIEDLTHEKRQIELNRRQEKEFRELRDDLETRLGTYHSELSKVSERFRRELEADYQRTRTALRIEEQKCALLAEEASLATAVIGPTGTFHQINDRFGQMLGYESADLPNFTECVMGTTDDRVSGGIASDWPAAFDRPEEGSMTPEGCTVMCRDGTKKEIHCRSVKLDDGNYFIACQEIEKPRSNGDN